MEGWPTFCVRRLVRSVWIWGLFAWGFRKMIAVFFWVVGLLVVVRGVEELLPHIGMIYSKRTRMRDLYEKEQW